jgi:bifunctional non-homologous end joining protein LigD
VVMARDQRRGKVFVDWSQNDRHKTTVCAYSLRARERPYVSAPISWGEVRSAFEANDPTRLELDTTEVLERVTSVGDLFEPNVTVDQELPALDAL